MPGSINHRARSGFSGILLSGTESNRTGLKRRLLGVQNDCPLIASAAITQFCTRALFVCVDLVVAQLPPQIELDSLNGLPCRGL